MEKTVRRSLRWEDERHGGLAKMAGGGGGDVWSIKPHFRDS